MTRKRAKNEPIKDPAPKLRLDIAETAHRVFLESTGDAPKTLPPNERTEKNSVAVIRGQKGGRTGGKERADELTKRRRVAIARKASKTRWKKPASE